MEFHKLFCMPGDQNLFLDEVQVAIASMECQGCEVGIDQDGHIDHMKIGAQLTWSMCEVRSEVDCCVTSSTTNKVLFPKNF